MSEKTCANCGKPLKEIRAEVMNDDGTSRWIPYDTGGKCMKCNGWMVNDSTSLIAYHPGDGIGDMDKDAGWQFIHFGDDRKRTI